jgi:hypothetical protein
MADDAAKPRAQEFEGALRALELMRVGVAPTMMTARLATRE